MIKNHMSNNIYQDIIVDSICGDIKKSVDNRLFAGSVILTLSAIDAMAFLGMPISETETKRDYYVEWVNKYMKTANNQPYQYQGIDFYGARCGIVHRYGVQSRLSEQGLCKYFSYHNGSEHIYKPDVDSNLILISIPRFTQDFFRAVQEFIKDIQLSDDLRDRVNSRIESLFRVVPANF